MCVLLNDVLHTAIPPSQRTLGRISILAIPVRLNQAGLYVSSFQAMIRRFASCAPSNRLVGLAPLCDEGQLKRKIPKNTRHGWFLTYPATYESKQLRASLHPSSAMSSATASKSVASEDMISKKVCNFHCNRCKRS